GVLFAGPRRPQDPARRAYPAIGRDGTAAASPAQEKRSEASVGLKAWAMELLGRDPRLFRRYCGDSYVASMRSGAMLFAAFTFKTSDRSVASKASAAVKAKYGAVSVSANASTENRNAASNTETTMNVIQIGGSGGAIPLSQDDLATKLKTFAQEAAEAPIFHTMEVASYDGLPDWPQRIRLTDGDGDAEIVADYYWFLSSFHEEIDGILENPAGYSARAGLAPAELKTLQDDVVSLQRNLRTAMEELSQGELPRGIDTLHLTLDVSGARTLTLAPPRPGAGSGGQVTTPDEWYRGLADKLRAAVPYQNPNTLRLKLPIPVSAATPLAERSDAEFQQAVVDYYLRPQARRMCALDASDNECLTNAELEDLARYVPIR
ncbi:MAG: hypothetical protein WAU86_21805, partial [Oricola sp.]